MTVLLRGDLDFGYLLIHQAVQEDIESSQQQRPDTPGYALVSLNYERIDQAFLLSAAGHTLTNAQLGEINGQFESNFDVTIQAAL